MKIGFCGSHGTGKTSVAEALAARANLRMITSASRHVQSIGYEINDKATVLSQAATSMARLAWQLDAGENFVSDRTLLDSMAYNQFQLETVWADDEKARFWFETMDAITKHSMKLYDLLVYFPVTFTPVADGVRDTDLEYQRAIDENVRAFIEKYNLNVYTVCSGTVENRVNFVEGLIYATT